MWDSLAPTWRRPTPGACRSRRCTSTAACTSWVETVFAKQSWQRGGQPPIGEGHETLERVVRAGGLRMAGRHALAGIGRRARTSHASRATDLQAGGDRGAGGADRALSGFAAFAGADGLNLTAGDRLGRALV